MNILINNFNILINKFSKYLIYIANVLIHEISTQYIIHSGENSYKFMKLL